MRFQEAIPIISFCNGSRFSTIGVFSHFPEVMGHAITHKSGSRSHLWTQVLDLPSMMFAEAVYGRDCKPLICRNRRTYG